MRGATFWAAAALVGVSVTPAAQAAMCNGLGQNQPFCLTDTVTWNGSPVVTDPNGAATPVNGVAAVSSYFLGDQFNSGGPISQNVPSPPAGGSGGPWNFYDSFVFELNGSASVQGAAIAFSNGFAGISNLQGRIFQVTTGSFATNGDYDAVAASNLSNLPASGVTVVDSWTTSQIGSSGYYVVMLNQTPLMAGDQYVLQLRGEVASSGSGSYSGTLSFTPIPASLWLFASALGALAAVLWRPPGFSRAIAGQAA